MAEQKVILDNIEQKVITHPRNGKTDEHRRQRKKKDSQEIH